MPAVLEPTRLIAHAHATLGGSNALTAEVLGISDESVARYVKRAPDDVCGAKKKLANKALAASEMFLESAVPDVEKMKPGEKIFAFGVCASRACDLTKVEAPLINLNLGDVSDARRALAELEAQLTPDTTTASVVSKD